jgi:hypothetical protein
MKMKSNSFPKLQIFLFFFLFLSFSCQKEKILIINKEQFIEIYARLLIINELRVKNEFLDSLVQELYSDNNITTANIDSTVSYYNSNPGEWVEVYNLVRERIQEIKTDLKAVPDSLSPKQRKRPPLESYRKNFLREDKEKELLDQRKKSEKRKSRKMEQNKERSD